MRLSIKALADTFSVIATSTANVASASLSIANSALEMAVNVAEMTLTQGQKPLHLAAARDDVVSVRALLASGADPNAINAAGQTPLYWAAHMGNCTAVRILLKSGAHVDHNLFFTYFRIFIRAFSFHEIIPVEYYDAFQEKIIFAIEGKPLERLAALAAVMSERHLTEKAKYLPEHLQDRLVMIDVGLNYKPVKTS